MPCETTGAGRPAWVTGMTMRTKSRQHAEVRKAPRLLGGQVQNRLRIEVQVCEARAVQQLQSTHDHHQRLRDGRT